MKKAILTLLWPLLFSAALHAVSSSGETGWFAQPDGTRVELRLLGDEFCHWCEDREGFAVVLDDSSGFWCYALQNRGMLVSSGMIVGRVAPGHLGLPRHLMPEASIREAYRMKRERASQFGLGRPAVGTLKNLVVLVAFSDMNGIKTKDQFADLFNEIGHSAEGAVGSVRDYYLETSHKKLTIESAVTDWIVLDNGFAHYGANDPNGWDVRPREMVAEALKKLDDSGFDFAPFDADKDGKIDSITIIHAGYGEEYSGNNKNFIWSHAWALVNPVVYDGVEIHPYHTEPELHGAEGSTVICRIGVICHETGHFLGLPDLYDYGYDARGVGRWSIMAGGSWGFKAAERPTHFDAWCKVQLGWIAPADLGASGQYTLRKVETNPDVARLSAGFPAQQYLLLENRQKHGFNLDIPQAGLSIWRVDDAQPDNDSQWYPGLDPKKHYRVALIQADGLWNLEKNQNNGDAGDIFHQAGITYLSQDTAENPNTGYYAAQPNLDCSAVGIYGVQSSGEDILFSLGANQPPSSPQLVSPENGKTGLGESVTFQWQRATDAEGNPLTHWFYLSQNPDFSGATPTPIAAARNFSQARDLKYCGLWAGILALLLAPFCSKTRKRLISLICLAVVLALLSASCAGGSRSSRRWVSPEPNAMMTHTVSGIAAGTHYWKVEATDGLGGRTPSATWTFATSSPAR